MEYNVIISDRAARMIGDHIRFVAQVNKKASIELKNCFLTAFQSLQTFPQRYPFFNEPYIIPNKYHKMFIEKYYIVLYQIKDSNVYVDYVIDCRKEYQWLIK